LEVVEDDAAVAEADVQRPRGDEGVLGDFDVELGKVASIRSVSIDVSLRRVADLQSGSRRLEARP